MFQKDQLYQRSPDVLYSPIGEEIVMMSIQNGEYYGSNQVGNRIWELLEKPHTPTELCAQLLEEYEIDEATCNNETLEFLEHLYENKLIVAV